MSGTAIAIVALISFCMGFLNLWVIFIINFANFRRSGMTWDDYMDMRKVSDEKDFKISIKMYLIYLFIFFGGPLAGLIFGALAGAVIGLPLSLLFKVNVFSYFAGFGPLFGSIACLGASVYYFTRKIHR